MPDDRPTPGVERLPFGTLADGRAVELIALTNAAGMTARIMTLGAAIQALRVPDRAGTMADIVLGHDSAAEYLARPQYFGATVGRYGNRVANGRFSLDGVAHRLDANDGVNHLHGGAHGLHQLLWTIVATTTTPNPAVTLACESPAGAGGYPGALSVIATYTLEPDTLAIDYRATADAPTIVNLTNHSYFNLAGAGAGRGILDQLLTIPAAAFTPIDAGLIPTGERRPVAGTAFDFRTPKPIGRDIRDGGDAQLAFCQGYDHNFVVDGAPGTMRLVARLEDPVSGRMLEVSSAAPGLQFYSGNFLDGATPGKDGVLYRQGDGLCLEPQVFPDAPNHPDFPSARLDPGQGYHNAIRYRFPR